MPTSKNPARSTSPEIALGLRIAILRDPPLAGPKDLSAQFMPFRKPCALCFVLLIRASGSTIFSHGCPWRPRMSDQLVIAGREFRSRLIVGTGKYRSFQEMVRAHEAS